MRSLSGKGIAEETFHWLALSLISGVGCILFKRLLDRFKTPEAVFRASKADLLSVEGLGEKVAGEIQRGPFEKIVERELYLIEKVGATIVTFQDENYPRRLKDIYDPPPLLYVRGTLKADDELAVSIVGSRKTTSYGRWITEKIAWDLVHHGITIVSGMARGIDTVAHQGAISGAGRTLAVLGCGVDVVYPPENRNIFGQIIDHGAVLSEFPMGAPPEGSHFPKRNRIISGLSIGVVVVEAGKRSGSLITANCALEQGRDVFAVPGNVGAEGSRGTNQLIKQGAKLVESTDDILEEILPQWRKTQQTSREAESPSFNLPEEEGALYRLLGETPRHIDALIRESGLDPGTVSSLLLNLELKSLVAQWPGKWFSRKMQQS
jgi:DNA processing protein